MKRVCAIVVVLALAGLPGCAQRAEPESLAGGAPVIDAVPAILFATPDPPAATGVAQTEAETMSEAIWAAAARMPDEKQARLKPEFLAMFTPDAYLTLQRKWEKRLGMPAPELTPVTEPFARRLARETVLAHGWDGFVARAQAGEPPFNAGRPEIMVAGVALAPDATTAGRIIAAMLALAGAPSSRSNPSDNFERGDFGHVLAEAAMERCDLALFDRAVALTPEPEALRYAFWRARITGGAEALARQLKGVDGDGDTRPVRQAIEGYGAILRRGYCAK